MGKEAKNIILMHTPVGESSLFAFTDKSVTMCVQPGETWWVADSTAWDAVLKRVVTLIYE